MLITFAPSWASKHAEFSAALERMYLHIDLTLMTLPKRPASLEFAALGAAIERTPQRIHIADQMS